MTLATRALMPDFGVEVLGCDLRDPDPDTLGEIRALYDRHAVLLFRDQSLAPAHQAALAHRFGRPKIETRKQFNLRDHPEVSTIGNVRDEGDRPAAFFVRGGFGWHTDGTAACHVDAATFLYAVEVPSAGGDTLLCSTASAYQRLDPALAERLAGLRMLCSFHAHNDPLHESDPDAFVPLTEAERAALPPVWHDVVQVHPVSGQTVLYMNFDPLAFDGAGAEEGRALLQAALDVATAGDAVYRHRWRPGDLLVWDNHATLHSATPSHMYEHDRRLMHRSFVYTEPTARPLPNLEEVNRIFMPD